MLPMSSLFVTFVIRRIVSRIVRTLYCTDKHVRYESTANIKLLNFEVVLSVIIIDMLQLRANLLNKDVLSLRSGSTIAYIRGPLINPDNLKIEGFFCEDRYDHKELILLCQDIRDTLAQGYVVNDHEALVGPEELVRFHKIIDLQYDPLGKQVVTLAKHRVGKITDYATEMNSMYIQKLYVTQSLLKSLSGSTLSIDRSLVQEITPREIIITDMLQQAPAATAAAIS